MVNGLLQDIVQQIIQIILQACAAVTLNDILRIKKKHDICDNRHFIFKNSSIDFILNYY